MNHHELKFTRIEYSLYELYKKYQRCEIDLEMEAVRNWPSKEKSNLIEAILLRVPLPPVYSFVTEDQRNQIAKGDLPFGVFIDYLEDGFALTGLEFFVDLEGKKFQQLDTKVQRKIQDYSFITYLIDYDNPDYLKYKVTELLKIKSDHLLHFFINSSDQRMLIDKLGKELEDLVKNELKINPTVFKEAVFRFFGFYFGNYRSYTSVQDYAQETLIQLHQWDYQDLMDLFVMALKKVVSVFDAFPILEGSSFSIGLFELLMVSCAKLEESVILKYKNRIQQEFSQLIEDDYIFKIALTEDSLTRLNVYYRYSRWLNQLDQIVREDGSDVK